MMSTTATPTKPNFEIIRRFGGPSSSLSLSSLSFSRRRGEEEQHHHRHRKVRTFAAASSSHDLRYAIDASKIERELGWRPAETFDSGIRKTVAWYLDTPQWWQAILSGEYQMQRSGTDA